MSLQVCAVQPEDKIAVRSFLATIFKVSEDAVFLNAEVFDWKYFLPRPDWVGPRSWVVKSDGRIVAHLGAWPVRFMTPHGPVECVHPMDWAADPEFPGVGVLLVRSFLKRIGTVFTVGGTDQAKRLLPSLGFSLAGNVEMFAKPILPWKLRGQSNVAAIARSGRMLARKLVLKRVSKSRHSGWSAEPVNSFPEQLGDMVEKAVTGDYTFLWRGVAALNYVLQCPIKSCRGFLLHANGHLRGYFVLARPGNQTRIADLRVDSLDPKDWAAAYSVALESAADDPGAHDITAFCSTDLVRSALEVHGFSVKASREVRFHDQRRLLPANRTQFQSIATDYFFLMLIPASLT